MNGNSDASANDEHPYGPGSHSILDDVREMPACYPIKGNIRDDGLRYYHRPDSRNYGGTRAEVWFDSPSAAEAAGFTLSPSHPDNNSGDNYEPGGADHPCTAAEVEANRLTAAGLTGAAALLGQQAASQEDHPYGIGSHRPLDDESEMPRFYPIKGNVRRNGSLRYHRPDSSNYGSTQPEVWFDSPTAAEIAGFELASTHPGDSDAADFEPGGSQHGWSASEVEGARLAAAEGDLAVDADRSGAETAGLAAAGAGAVAGAGALFGREQSGDESDESVGNDDPTGELPAGDPQTEDVSALAGARTGEDTNGSSDETVADVDADGEADADADVDLDANADGEVVAGDDDDDDGGGLGGAAAAAAAAGGAAAVAGLAATAGDDDAGDDDTGNEGASEDDGSVDADTVDADTVDADTVDDDASEDDGADDDDTVDDEAVETDADADPSDQDGTDADSDGDDIAAAAAVTAAQPAGLAKSREVGSDADDDADLTDDDGESGAGAAAQVGAGAKGAAGKAAKTTKVTSGSVGNRAAATKTSATTTDNDGRRSFGRWLWIALGLLALLLLALLLGQCGDDGAGVGTDDDATTTAVDEATSDGETAGDAAAAEGAEMQTLALAALSAAGFDGVDVEIDGDTVRLVGDVASDADAEAALAAVGEIDGMDGMSVESALEVTATDDNSEDSDDAANSDDAAEDADDDADGGADLQALALAALGEAGFDGLDVELDGDTLRLTGDVESEADADAALAALGSVDGMADLTVENELAIAGAAGSAADDSSGDDGAADDGAGDDGAADDGADDGAATADDDSADGADGDDEETPAAEPVDGDPDYTG